MAANKTRPGEAVEMQLEQKRNKAVDCFPLLLDFIVKSSRSASINTAELIVEQLTSLVESVADAPKQLQVLVGALGHILGNVVVTMRSASIADQEKILEPLWQIAHLPAVADVPVHFQIILNAFSKIVNYGGDTKEKRAQGELWYKRIIREIKKGLVLPAMHLIKRMKAFQASIFIIDDLITLIAESLTVYMAGRKDARTEPPRKHGSVTHAEQIQRRLDCIVFLRRSGDTSLELNIVPVEIWSCLVTNNHSTTAADDRDRCFRWFVSRSVTVQFIETTLLPEDPQLLASEAGVACVMDQLQTLIHHKISPKIIESVEQHLQLVLEAQAARSSENAERPAAEAATGAPAPSSSAIEAITVAITDAKDEEPTQNPAAIRSASALCAANTTAVPDPAGQPPSYLQSQQYRQYVAALTAELEAMPSARADDLLRRMLAMLMQK